MSFLTADALDRAEARQPGCSGAAAHPDADAQFRATRDAPKVCGDALEMRGGIGYIEEFATPRLLRDAHLGRSGKAPAISSPSSAPPRGRPPRRGIRAFGRSACPAGRQRLGAAGLARQVRGSSIVRSALRARSRANPRRGRCPPCHQPALSCRQRRRARLGSPPHPRDARRRPAAAAVAARDDTGCAEQSVPANGKCHAGEDAALLLGDREAGMSEVGELVLAA